MVVSDRAGKHTQHLSCSCPLFNVSSHDWIPPSLPLILQSFPFQIPHQLARLFTTACNSCILNLGLFVFQQRKWKTRCSSQCSSNWQGFLSLPSLKATLEGSAALPTYTASSSTNWSQAFPSSFSWSWQISHTDIGVSSESHPGACQGACFRKCMLSYFRWQSFAPELQVPML